MAARGDKGRFRGVVGELGERRPGEDVARGADQGGKRKGDEVRPLMGVETMAPSRLFLNNKGEAQSLEMLGVGVPGTGSSLGDHTGHDGDLGTCSCSTKLRQPCAQYKKS